MRKSSATPSWRLLLLLVLCHLFAGRDAMAQRERQIEAPSQSDYGSKFADQLRSLFGRFRDTDLRRAFNSALPIRCSELVSGDGEWRPVAFFNEDRKLGEWYHRSLDDVKAELSAYIFKGTCRSEQSTVQVVTKAPVSESLESYSAGKIPAKDILVNVNAGVNASFDPRSEAYQFDLPYLYTVRGMGGSNLVYSLFAPKATDRYATGVTNLWDCKRVYASDVTFQFLICQTWTTPRDSTIRSQSKPSFGSFAYFILSDGREASTSVKLSFGGPGDSKEPTVAPNPPAEPGRSDRPLADEAAKAATDTPGGWQIPDTASKLAAVANGEFRIRFSPQTWANKIGSSQVLVDQRMSSLDPSNAQSTSDYCVWRPASLFLAPRALAPQPDAEVAYTVKTTDGDRRSPASMSFDLKTLNGSAVGALQCFFHQAESAAAIPFDRWVNVVGAHLTLEIRP